MVRETQTAFQVCGVHFKYIKIDFVKSSQQLEQDAERNANASVVEFYNRIQEFFNKSC